MWHRNFVGYLPYLSILSDCVHPLSPSAVHTTQMADYFKGIFTVVAGATAGFMTVQIVMAFFAVLFAGSGAYLVWKYNKKTNEGKPTPLLKQMTTLPRMRRWEANWCYLASGPLQKVAAY